jgi:hypothetical protein
VAPLRTPCLKFAALVLVLGLPLSLAAQGSLGDLARHLREQREKAPKKAVKVYTNDNLPARPPGEGPTASASMSTEEETKATPSSTAEASGKTAEGPEAEKTGSAEDKKKTQEYWQGRFKALRRGLAGAEEALQLSKDELNLLQVQDARAIDPNEKTDLDAKVQAKQGEVKANQDATDKVIKQLDDLEKEFADSGAPADWSKTD